MPRRAPRRTNGSRGILTPALADRITNLVAHGNYIATAAQACGVGERTIYDWISKGEEAAQALAKGEPVAPRAHLYVRFAQGLADARARAETDAVEVVEQVMRGGHLLEEAPIVTPDGRLARDDQGEILYRRKYAPPDGKLALAYLGAAPGGHRGRWGACSGRGDRPGRRPRHEAPGARRAPPAGATVR
jgi:hypothetical protein